jgi:hypothetical protein
MAGVGSCSGFTRVFITAGRSKGRDEKIWEGEVLKHLVFGMMGQPVAYQA